MPALGVDGKPMLPTQAPPAGAPPKNVGGGKLVEAPGAGNVPWLGVQDPSPRLAPKPIAPTTKLDLTGISAARGVLGEIRRQAQLQGVPVALALAVAKQESGYRQEAISSAGAIGIMQLMPSTASGLGVDPNNWKENIRGGVRYLRLQYEHFHNWRLATAAYNGGPGVVESGNWPSETQAYVSSVAAIAKQISNGTYKPAGGSTGIVVLSAPLPGNPVVTSGYGPRNNPLGGGGDFHYGVDLSAPQGTPIHAMLGGTVVFSGWDGTGGNTVEIKDKQGRVWTYHHMVTTPVAKLNQNIQAGQQIGNVGSTGASTGPHLHIGLQPAGSSQYVNPMGVIRKAFGAGWNKKAKVTISTTDLLPPSSGGVNGSGQPAMPGGGGAELSATGLPTAAPHGVDAAVTPGGQASIPSNAAAWQQILNSGSVSPETKNLATQAGAVDGQSLAASYSNTGQGY